MSYGQRVTGALVYNQRMENVRGAARNFVDQSLIEAATGLVRGFGHNNRQLLRGVGIKR